MILEMCDSSGINYLKKKNNMINRIDSIKITYCNTEQFTQTYSISSESYIYNTKQFTQAYSIPSESYIYNTKQFTQTYSISSESYIYNTKQFT